MKDYDFSQEENEFITGGTTDEFVAHIKVMGVGGGGCNAVNRMIEAGIGEGVEFYAVNTDKQALNLSSATNRIQIGSRTTRGLGAGANPSQGQIAAEEDADGLREILRGTDLLFLTAGMGGGTGTGALPVIANIAKEEGILTIAVVTKPFGFEGERRMRNAELGIENLNKNVDTLVIVPNQKLVDTMPKDATFKECFKKADEILRQSIQGIVDLIVHPNTINCDFANVKTVIQQAGMCHIGIGHGEGEDRHIQAVKDAVSSPLLETTIEGATAVIVNITGNDIRLNEVNEASSLIEKAIAPDALFIFGYGENDQDEGITITIIATGFKQKKSASLFRDEPGKVIQDIYNIPVNPAGIRQEVEQPPMPQVDDSGIENPRVRNDYSLPKFMRRR